VTPSRALYAALAGPALGALVQYLFVRELVGLNVLASVLGFAVVALPLRGGPLRRADVLLLGALAFASFAAVRAEAAVVAFDVAAAVALLLAWLVPVAELPGALVARTVPAYAAAVPAARGRLPRSERPLRYAAGAALAIPFLVIFTALFASADAVFDRSLRDLRELAWLRELTRDLGARALVMVAAAWCATGLLSRAAVPSAMRGASRDVRTRISRETAVAMLIAIDLLFGLFVALQVAYLFGGRDTVEAVGVTYSAYARRGFFELVGAATLVGVLLFAVRGRAFVVAALALLALTSVVLASAAYRMSLYQQAYGWSELRLYANALIVLLAIALVLLALAVVARRIDRVPVQLVMAAAVVALAVNAIGPARTVAAANLDRFIDPSGLPNDAYRGLDVWYLIVLGDAVVPAIYERLPALPPFFREQIVVALAAPRRPSELGRGWQSWNWDRARASEAFASR
jgi:uncharacterized membrane protein YidH (DUF202 family)